MDIADDALEDQTTMSPMLKKSSRRSSFGGMRKSFGSPQLSAMDAAKVDGSPLNVLLNSARKARRKSLLRCSPNKDKEQSMFDKVKHTDPFFSINMLLPYLYVEKNV